MIVGRGLAPAVEYDGKMGFSGNKCTFPAGASPRPTLYYCPIVVAGGNAAFSLLIRALLASC